ncbi:MAG: sortase [Patescibacteria group bacterium]|nr:sortase [Patescibacteria group bacterium]
MRPDESISNQGGSDNTSSSQQAAARIVRAQIDELYENSAQEETQTKQYDNPYQRVHSEHTAPQDNKWKQYHTAWQNYYQQYYEGYYTHHLHKAQEAIANQQSVKESETISKDEALFDLRQDLIGKVQKSATKVRKSRHFIPIASGLAVILIFLFLQFNRLIISNVLAYVSPGDIDPQNIVIDPNANLAVTADPKLIIPKINVDVPVIYDIGTDYDSQMTAMAKGVAQFAIPGADSHPGQIGNTVIAGHSSNDLLDSGDYKFIFAQLDKLVEGDTIYLNYKSKRYTYTVTKKEVVKPTEVNKLVYTTTKPILTLITCTPIGTSINRLLVTAEQISPNPNEAIAAPKTNVNTNNSSIPGNSPTLLERLFGN